MIKQLEESTVSKIAAGEVIERPASVIKELVENAIDAGATIIEIEIEGAGLKTIKISDNGSGMTKKDSKLAFEKHTTSKISQLEDLDRLRTLGFRGEALPSIAAVSRIELVTKPKAGAESGSASQSGTKLMLEGGKITSAQDIGCPEGTIISVKDLFYNVPARKKYMKSERTELAHITDWVMRFALSYPTIRFRLVKEGTELLSTPATGKLLDTIASIFGPSFARELIPIDYKGGAFKLTGCVGKPALARRDNTYQYFYVNGRYVRSKFLGRALSEAYHTILMKHKYPTAVLNMTIDPAKVDVNIHPTKLTIHFMEEPTVYQALVGAVRSSLDGTDLMPQLEFGAASSEPGAVSLLSQSTLGIKSPEMQDTDTGISEQDDRLSVDASSAPIKITRPVSIQPTVTTFSQTTADVTVEKSVDAEPDYEPSLQLAKTGILPIGQLHDSYILVQTDQGLMIVDQHALHERVMYEKLRNLYETEPVLSQELIMPVSFEFNTRDYQILIGYEEMLRGFGFELEAFGENTIRIRAVPTVLGRLEDESVLNELLSDLLALGRVKNEEMHREKIIQIMACKAAIKAGQKLTEAEITKLLASMSELTSPYTCAHGRPTIISMTIKELEKQFKRT
ncbi:MAG: DNA mismatch repair endonuclease MutL [Thermoplasmata archaeon]|nr:MAG: DNA mismatch repair endonuclease MutL [Thermoplasmata archaeon]